MPHRRHVRMSLDFHQQGRVPPIRGGVPAWRAGNARDRAIVRGILLPSGLPRLTHLEALSLLLQPHHTNSDRDDRS
jgi:hypothetical protein